MKTGQIWKFPIESARTTLSLPKGAKILTVQLQRSSPCLWAIVDPNEPTNEMRKLFVVGTGWDFNFESLTYIGTYQPSDMLVFHVFEELAP